MRTLLQQQRQIAQSDSISDKEKIAQLQNNLDKLEERYHQMVELSPEAIIICNDYTILFANSSGVDLLGVPSKDDLTECSILDFIHSDYRTGLSEYIKEILNEGNPSPLVQKQFIRFDHEIIDVEIKAVPILYEGQMSIQLFCRDITLLKSYHHALAESEYRYKNLLELLPEPVIGYQDFTIAFMNEACLKLFGVRNTKEIIGKSIFDFILPKYQDVIKKRFEHLKSSDQVLGFEEIELVASDGRILNAEVSSINIYKDVEHPIILSVIRDVTESKRKEEYIRRSETLSVLGQLAAGIAHEIRNPLATLIGFAQLIQKGSKKDYSNIMLSELDRISSIVNEFLYVAKPKEAHIQQYHLVRIMKEVIVLLEAQAHYNNIEMILNTDENIPCLPCDKNQMKQVFMNLIKNAIEAMPQGGTIRIYIMSPEESQVQVLIEDTGCGIPKEKLKNIKQPFFTLKEKGTGLGLMVCESIISNHRGELNITSEIDKGTKVQINLPAE